MGAQDLPEPSAVQPLKRLEVQQASPPEAQPSQDGSLPPKVQPQAFPLPPDALPSAARDAALLAEPPLPSSA